MEYMSMKSVMIYIFIQVRGVFENVKILSHSGEIFSISIQKKQFFFFILIILKDFHGG